MDQELLNGVCGVYVVHALHNYEHHEKWITKLFNKHKIDFEFVSDGDPSTFTPELLNKYFITDIDKTLTKGITSCALNHFYSLERVIERKNSYAIIFEDDVIFLGDFKKKIHRIWNQVEKLEPGFIISLENMPLTFPSFWQTKKGKFLYPATQGRMAAAYLIDMKAAEAMLANLQIDKCDLPLDWWHNKLIDKGVIKMYWAHPPLVEQGSHNGMTFGSISSRNKSTFRKFKWLCQKTYKYSIRRLFNDRRIIKSNR